jgi:hypothetical protein
MQSMVKGKNRDLNKDSQNKIKIQNPKATIKPLPSNFQENVILKEMKFDNGQRDLEIIKELLYLYSVFFNNIARDGIL